LNAYNKNKSLIDLNNKLKDLNNENIKSEVYDTDTDIKYVEILSNKGIS